MVGTEHCAWAAAAAAGRVGTDADGSVHTYAAVTRGVPRLMTCWGAFRNFFKDFQVHRGGEEAGLGSLEAEIGFQLSCLGLSEILGTGGGMQVQI